MGVAKDHKEVSNMDKPSGKEIIQRGEWADCFICAGVYKRRRQTARYCLHCKRAFCEGEHGTFEGKGFGVCVKCYKI